MKKILALIISLMLVIGLCLTGCTSKQRAKDWGGKTKIELPAGQKLVTATWKESNLWYLTRPTRPDEKAERYEFIEDSSYGVLEGKVIFTEHEK